MITVSQVSVKTLLSKSKIPGFDYAINPYVGCPHKCIYCYAEFMRHFTDHTEPWGDFLDVRQPQVPLRPSKLFHTRVLLSSVTDPYNPYEAQYKRTRSILTELQAAQAYVHILTKSALVTRDVDLLRQMPGCQVGFSFSSADDSFRKQAEPGASSVEDKIDALKFLHKNGIYTFVMIAPIMPKLTHWQDILERTCPYTQHYHFDRLNLRFPYSQKVMDFIKQNYPSLFPFYQDIFNRTSSSYWKNLSQNIRTYCKQKNISASVFFEK